MQRKLKRKVISFLTVFIIVATFNNAFAIDAPVLTTSSSGLEVSLSWTPVAGATGYTLYYAPYPYIGTNKIGQADMGTDTSISFTLWNGASYYVAITSRNGSSESEFSNVNLFTIDTTSPSIFPLSQAMKSFVTRGFSSNFFVQQQTGNIVCSGYGNRTVAPAATLTTFNVTPTEIIPVFSAADTITINLTNCTPAYSATIDTLYYDTNNYVLLGFNSPGFDYGAYLEEPFRPVTVSIGDTGIIGTEYLYTDSNETTNIGFINVSYVVTAGVGTTAIVTIIGNNYDTHNTLISTQRDNWEITTEGFITPISTNILYSSGDNITLTYTND